MRDLRLKSVAQAVSTTGIVYNNWRYGRTLALLSPPELKVRCSKCNRKLRAEDIDARQGIGVCRRCGIRHSLAELTSAQKELPGNLRHPPAGTWFKRLPDGFEVGASTRSLHAFYLVTMSFVLICATAGFASDFLHTGEKAHLWETLMALVVFTVLGWPGMMAALGHVAVGVQGNEAVLFQGVGILGWRRRFAWNEVTSIQIQETRQTRHSLMIARYISIAGPKRVSFGSRMTTERMIFVLIALQLMLRSHVPQTADDKYEMDSAGKK